MGYLDGLVMMDKLVLLVLLEIKVHLEREGKMEGMEWMAKMVEMEIRELLVNRDHLVGMDKMD